MLIKVGPASIDFFCTIFRGGTSTTYRSVFPPWHPPLFDGTSFPRGTKARRPFFPLAARNERTSQPSALSGIG